MSLFTNQATLSYSGGTASSNVVTGEVVDTIAAEKTAVSGEYAPGEGVTYSVSIRNTGTTPLTGLTLTDDLGGYDFDGVTVYPLAYEEGTLLCYVDGVLQPQPAVTAGPPLEVTGLELPAGASAMILYQARVTPYAPPGPGGTVTNTAALAGAGRATQVEVSAVITPRSEAQLTVSKALSPRQIPYNGQVTYTFRVENSGGTEAGAGDLLSLSDVFSPILSGLTVVYNGAAQSEPGFYSYDTATGTFTTAPGAITVPAAAYSQNDQGIWTVQPGVSVLTVTGTLSGGTQVS